MESNSGIHRDGVIPPTSTTFSFCLLALWWKELDSLAEEREDNKAGEDNEDNPIPRPVCNEWERVS